ncbi:hypothetical protein DY000_02031134 [Brassica cretica]|uniref:Uncharacterized protein n=1 Tax=Brassica cretica TaxID=69181 RepID=A0ABQ7DSN4_BRACR|nr:hypothetical protein DY000_02031134 [Brassica cretica]
MASLIDQSNSPNGVLDRPIKLAIRRDGGTTSNSPNGELDRPIQLTQWRVGSTNPTHHWARWMNHNQLGQWRVGSISFNSPSRFNRYTATELWLEPGCYVALARVRSLCNDFELSSDVSILSSVKLF